MSETKYKDLLATRARIEAVFMSGFALLGVPEKDKPGAACGGWTDMLNEFDQLARKYGEREETVEGKTVDRGFPDSAIDNAIMYGIRELQMKYGRSGEYPKWGIPQLVASLRDNIAYEPIPGQKLLEFDGNTQEKRESDARWEGEPLEVARRNLQTFKESAMGANFQILTNHLTWNKPVLIAMWDSLDNEEKAGAEFKAKKAWSGEVQNVTGWMREDFEDLSYEQVANRISQDKSRSNGEITIALARTDYKGFWVRELILEFSQSKSYWQNMTMVGFQ